LAGSKKSRTSQPAAAPRSAGPSASASPEIKVVYAPVGRETLEAISSELATEASRRHLESTPEIVIGTTPLGRETLAAIEEELEAARPSVVALPKPRRARSSRPPARKASSRAPAPASPEIFEMLTFVVKNAEDGDFTTEKLRRSFVEQHLRNSLRGHALNAISRVDVTPWTDRGAVVVRVWCRV
jgi:hypothetical protein